MIGQTTPYDQIKPRSKRSRSMARYIRGKRDHVDGERSQTRQVKVDVEKTISKIVAERFYNGRERGSGSEHDGWSDRSTSFNPFADLVD